MICALRMRWYDVSCELLFVYGTLRRRFERHSLLQNLAAGYVGNGTICGELFDLGDFPGAVKASETPQESGGTGEQAGRDAGKLTSTEEIKPVTAAHRNRPRTVVGELFRLRNPERAFRLLDAYEGASTGKGLYSREQTEVTLDAGGRVTAWVYWLNRAPEGMRRIISGDYAKK